MSDLLDSVLAAHGGLDRWTKVKSITVDASITGALWDVKRAGAPPNGVRFEVDTTREFLRLDFIGKDKRSVFEPHRVVMSTMTAPSSMAATTQRSRLTDITSRHRGTTSTSPIFSVRRCGRISTYRFSTSGPRSPLAGSYGST